MGNRVLRARDTTDELGRGIAVILAEQELQVEFPDQVVAAAVRAVRQPRLPELDRTDIAFVTVDPPGAMDLDQALHFERTGDGYLVHYAIADLAAFVAPGDALDLEAHRRGESMYGADVLVPLHPRELSEGAASLLPDQICPANLWSIQLDAAGQITDATVEKARVRSTARLDYETVQKQLDDGSASEVLQLLKEIGELRTRVEEARGGISLPMPEQQVDCTEGQWKLEFRSVLAVESWNAQISLLTGFAAASMMVEAKVGILRTLPPPETSAINRLRRTAKALKIDWPENLEYPAFIRSLDPARSNEAAMVVACTTILRGAGYVGFDGEVPTRPEHAALASTYAHVTAPLRRLVDRYGLEVCVALSAGRPVPDWVTAAFETLPATMADSGRRANAYQKAVLNLAEAQTLRGRLGEQFTGVVLEADRDNRLKGDVMVRDPAVEAPVTGRGALPVGEEVELTLVQADPATRTVRFTL